MALSQRDKDAQLKKHPKCYVCGGLGLPHATFKGYDRKHIQFDHWKPKGVVGSNQSELVENQLPVHADPDGASYLDDNYETSTHRNCHKGKGNKYSSGDEWVTAVRIWRRAKSVEYSDDLLPDRSRSDKQYQVDIEWDDASGHVTFNGDRYPMMIQKTASGDKEIVWRSFATVVNPALLWRDLEVQTRPAEKKRVAEMAIHLRTKPLLSPILCRLEDRRLNVFDGNHRLCAFLLSRPDHGIPVTIFEGPDPKLFLEVAGQAHDELTQQKYQYTAKALKYSALHEDELATAEKKHGKDASEKLAWDGLTAKVVRLRIVGRITQVLDERGGWRVQWKAAGLTDKSWNDFLAIYARLAPVADSFESAGYHREAELDNLAFLCKVFSEELFERFGKVPEARSSLKTKWWKLAHRRLATRLAQLLRDRMNLPETPQSPAYVPAEWDAHVQKRLRAAAKKWADSPVWRTDTTANNEPDVVQHLSREGFTETYLMD